MVSTPLYPREEKHPIERCKSCGCLVFVNEAPWHECEGCGDTVCCAKEYDLSEGLRLLCSICADGLDKCDSCDTLSLDLEPFGDDWAADGQKWLCEACRKKRENR